MWTLGLGALVSSIPPCSPTHTHTYTHIQRRVIKLIMKMRNHSSLPQRDSKAIRTLFWQKDDDDYRAAHRNLLWNHPVATENTKIRYQKSMSCYVIWVSRKQSNTSLLSLGSSQHLSENASPNVDQNKVIGVLLMDDSVWQPLVSLPAGAS